MDTLNRVPHSVSFGRMAPTLPVADLDRSLRFYLDVLGFEKVFEAGSPVGFVILKKDAAELHLSRDGQHRGTTQNVAHLMVTDADAFHAHLERHQVRIVKGLRTMDIGLRSFVFADPDGNRIDVGETR
ncbi:glyoxalase superfamily protein [Pandoraea norimbergensis]|uniref:Glyoxalase n=1 Tax=Pandoraea norimbergensis TaxID=93219 RepID=A0ABN4JDR4_9BURK|nr:glyoxalase superfamily protein [Pandoraea norimbergensis]ALS58985.1 glyoxalase [Pandoraea norimbergensis]